MDLKQKLKEHSDKAAEHRGLAEEHRGHAKKARDGGDKALARNHEGIAADHEAKANEAESKADEVQSQMDKEKDAEKKAAAPVRVGFAAIAKVDEEKRLVYGRATAQIPDRQGETLDYEKSKPYFERWSQEQLSASMGKSAGNVRGMHGKIAAGILTPTDGIIFNDAEKAIDVVAHVVDDGEWEKVMKGVYTGFSIGGRYVSKSQHKDGSTSYVADPSEISLVDRPAVPTATFFEVHKADGSVQKVEFHPVVMIKLADEAGADLGLEINKDELPEAGKEFKLNDRTFLLKAVEGELAKVEEQFAIAGTEADLAAFSKLMAGSGLTLAQATEKLAAAIAPAQRIRAISDTEVLGKAAQMAMDEEKFDLLKAAEDDSKRLAYLKLARTELENVAAREDVTPADKKRAESEASDFADEKNKKYKLDTKEQAKAAWSYINMPKNAAKYDPKDLAVIKGKIKAAAKKFGIEISEKVHEDRLQKVATAIAKAEQVEFEKLESGDDKRADFLARAEKAIEAQELRKGLYTVASLANLLQNLCDMMTCVEMEAVREGDDSDIADRICDVVEELGQILVDMATEEVKEEVGGDADNTGPVVPQGVVEMATKVRDLAKAQLAKSAPADEEKLKKRAQEMHDLAVASGAACAHVEKTDLSKVDLSKVEGESAKLLKSMQDQLGSAASTIEKMAKRIDTLERQPAAQPKTIIVRAVSKGDDGGSQSAEMTRAAQIAASVEPVKKSDGSIDEVATATKIMMKMGGQKVTLTKD